MKILMIFHILLFFRWLKNPKGLDEYIEGLTNEYLCSILLRLCKLKEKVKTYLGVSEIIF